ncbi:hypothetical protein EVAR_60943_1 [Eumeta japonica]|uniref:Uncharacterized protein n=1 Tax=Eumeta variegata TaxID=151549 RepID=A0A4C1XSF5_EUMVA|nr:hypothetical protein EVAR_60943_1 [Eumeta japonica]
MANSSLNLDALLLMPTYISVKEGKKNGRRSTKEYDINTGNEFLNEVVEIRHVSNSPLARSEPARQAAFVILSRWWEAPDVTAQRRHARLMARVCRCQAGRRRAAAVIKVSADAQRGTL